MKNNYPSKKITSLQNPHIKELVRLKDRRHRDQTGLFLIEGYRELLRGVEKKAPLKSLYFCAELFLGKNEPLLLQKAWEMGAEMYELSLQAFSKVSYRDRPDGLLAVGYQKHRNIEELDFLLSYTKNPFLLVVEAVEKPGNLGSIMRSSDGAGVDAIIVCDPMTDIYNPNVIRSSVGTFFSLPLFEVQGQQALAYLKKKNIPVISASPSATELYTALNYEGPLAFVVGTEQLGLSKLWMENADQLVCIPMLGMADSLNVAAATTLLLYEVVRQRKS